MKVNKFGVVLLLSFCLIKTVLGNSAGVGIPCSSGFSNKYKLGHPTRGGLQEYQDRLDAASGNAAQISAITEERVEHMKEMAAEGYKMLWTLPPVHSTRYTIRVGDADKADDPTSYIPGQWMNVYIRTLDEGAKFTGLVMYAVDGDNKEVGEWKVDPASAFRFGRGPDAISCVTHRNAELKRYLNVFKFKAPSKGTGTIKFNVIVKVGLAFPVLDGTFFYPNAAPLTLREGGVMAQKWFEGEAGKSCDAVCGAAGMSCDLPTLTEVGNNKETFAAMAMAFSPSCMGPIMPGCSASAPSVGSEGCFFHDNVCEDKPIVPPPVRKDPCEGLRLFQGNGRLQPNECVRWSYVRQNNGVGRNVYNKLYQQGDRVKVCCGSSSAELKDQDAFNNNMKVTGKCAPPGGFTPSPTPRPPPPRVKAKTSCAAVDNDVEDGGRICACKAATGPVPTSDPTPSPTPSPTNTRSNPVPTPTNNPTPSPTNSPTNIGDTSPPTKSPIPTTNPSQAPTDDYREANKSALGNDVEPVNGESSGSETILILIILLLLCIIYVGVRFNWVNKDGYDDMWLDCLPEFASSKCPTCWTSITTCPYCKPCHDKIQVVTPKQAADGPTTEIPPVAPRWSNTRSIEKAEQTRSRTLSLKKPNRPPARPIAPTPHVPPSPPSSAIVAISESPSPPAFNRRARLPPPKRQVQYTSL